MRANLFFKPSRYSEKNETLGAVKPRDRYQSERFDGSRAKREFHPPDVFGDTKRLFSFLLHHQHLAFVGRTQNFTTIYILGLVTWKGIGATMCFLCNHPHHLGTLLEGRLDKNLAMIIFRRSHFVCSIDFWWFLRTRHQEEEEAILVVWSCFLSHAKRTGKFGARSCQCHRHLTKTSTKR